MIAVLIICVSCVVAWVLHTWAPPLPPGLPGLSGTTWLGSIPAVAFKQFGRIPDFIVEMSQRHNGRPWGFNMPRLGHLYGKAWRGPGLVLVVGTPEAIKHILRDRQGNYVKGDFFALAMQELMGTGIFAVDGPQWKLHRKVASRMFTTRLQREGSRVAAEKCRDLVRHLKALPPGEPVDLQDTFFRLTIDIFSLIAFGIDLESVTRAEPHPFARAFDEVQRECNARLYNPFFMLCRLLQLTESERKIKRGAKVIHAFAQEVIATKRRSELDELGPDLLSRFIADAATKEAAERSGQAASEEARISGSDAELRDIVLNFMIAGRDTTACLLSWTFYELARVPHVQARLREEAAAVLGGSAAGDAEWDSNLVVQLEYAHAVVLEVLRLHPSVPVNLKFAVSEDTLPDGTNVPTDTQVVFSPYAMGRDGSIWDEPLRFKPERFLGGQRERSVYEYPAFNAGPRLCLGKPLAMMESKLVLVTLLQHFEFELAEPHEGGYGTSLVLPMQPGLLVRLSPR
jgi:cytochrome P450